MATTKAPPKITRTIARKVLETVDAGLCSGLGKPKPGFMCVEAAVCFALGLPHSDDPKCVSRAVRSIKIGLNDRSWSSNEARAKGLRRLAIAQLGSDKIDDNEFLKRLAEKIIRKLLPRTLRLVAERIPKHKDSLLAAADKCEQEGTQESAREARTAAYAAAYAAANAAAYAADAAYAAADAAYAAAYAADAAANAADAADAADAAARDKFLAFFADLMVDVLIEMKAPGVKFLDLVDA